MRIWFLFLLYAIVFIALKSAVRMPGDFLLIAVIYLGFYEDWHVGLFLSLLLGFLLDVVSLSPLGISIFSFGVVYGLILFFRNKISFQSWPSRFFWVFLFTFIGNLIVLGFLDASSRTVDYFRIFLLHLMLGSLANGVLGIFLIPFLKGYGHLRWQNLFKTKDILLKK